MYDYDRICYPVSLVIILTPSVIGSLLVLAGILAGVVVLYKRRCAPQSAASPPRTLRDLPEEVLMQMFVLPEAELNPKAEDDQQG